MALCWFCKHEIVDKKVCPHCHNKQKKVVIKEREVKREKDK